MELEIIAFTASAIGSMAYIPQILKILNTKDTAALSYQNYILMFSSSLTWILFGIASSVLVIAAWNTIFAFLALTIIFLKFFNENPEATFMKPIRIKKQE